MALATVSELHAEEGVKGWGRGYSTITLRAGDEANVIHVLAQQCYSRFNGSQQCVLYQVPHCGANIKSTSDS